MLIDDTAVDPVFKGFKTIYNDAFVTAPAHAEKVGASIVARPFGCGMNGPTPGFDRMELDVTGFNLNILHDPGASARNPAQPNRYNRVRAFDNQREATSDPLFGL